MAKKAAQGCILAKYEGKDLKNIDDLISLAELFGLLCVVGGIVLFGIAKCAPEPTLAAYAMPLLFIGVPFLMMRKGLEEEKLHYRTNFGAVFWLLFTFCFVMLAAEWSWLMYNVAEGSPLNAGKFDSIADLMLCLSVCAMGLQGAWASGLGFDSVEGKCEWTGNILVALTAPPMESLLCYKAYGGTFSHWIMMSLSLLLGTGIILEGVAAVLEKMRHEKEEQEEVPEVAPLKPSLKKAQAGQNYESVGCCNGCFAAGAGP